MFFLIKLKLFIEFIKIGSLAFGGGFATLPFIYELINRTQWITPQEIDKMITISQMTPGPLACNIATYIGFRIDGISRRNYFNNWFCYTIDYFYDYYK